MAFLTKPELDIDVRTIYDYLDARSHGDSVTYVELTALIGRDVQNGARAVLLKSTKRQRRERLRVWTTIRNTGIKLASDAEVAMQTPEQARLKIGRAARRAAETLAAISNFESLSRSEKTSVLTAQSYLGAVSAFSKPAAHKRLEEKINASTEAKALPLAATLEAFR